MSEEQQHPQKRREIDVERFPQSKFVMAVVEEDAADGESMEMEQERSSIQELFRIAVSGEPGSSP